MKPKLTPRAVAALSISAVSLFLFLCFAGYGRAEAGAALPHSGATDAVASWFIGPLGAGAHVIALSGLAWGVIVYFQERTPDLPLRLGSTVTLAASTAMLFGLAHGEGRSIWAGTVGTAGAKLFGSLGGLGTALGSIAAIVLFGISLVFATDWLFHTLRRGERKVFDPRNLPTEPARSDLLDDPGDVEPREFVRSESRAAALLEIFSAAPSAPAVPAAPATPAVPAVQAVPVAPMAQAETAAPSAPAASSGPVAPAAPSAAPAATPDPLLRGFVVRTSGGRAVLQGPSGYAGVEFLTPTDELAIPEEDPTPVSPQFLSVVDDVWSGSRAAVPFDETIELEGAPEAPEPAPAASGTARAPEDVRPARADRDRREPISGIGLADETLLLDDMIPVPSTFGDVLGLPNDGASTAHEIANAYDEPDSPGTSGAAAAPPAVAAPAVPPSQEPRGRAFEDDVLFDPGVVLDDDFTVAEQSPRAEPAAPAAAPPLLREPEPVEGFADAPELPETPEMDVASVFDTPLVDLPLSHVEPAFEAAPRVAWPVPAETFDAVEPEAAEPPAPPAPAPAAELPEGPEDEFVGTDFVLDPFLAQDEAAGTPEPLVAASEPKPVFEAPPVVESVPEPLAEETAPPAQAAIVPAPVAEAPAAAPETKEQLRLFPPASCDFSALASMELDPLFHDAVAAILVRDRASAVVLQRALGIGYARGLRILDQMTDAGMLGPDSPGGAREILFTEAQWRARA